MPRYARDCSAPVVPDLRSRAFEACDACGVRSLCTRGACPECGILSSVCEMCLQESGGRALEWQIVGHVKRAHGAPRRRRDPQAHRVVAE